MNGNKQDNDGGGEDHGEIEFDDFSKSSQRFHKGFVLILKFFD